jgi:hypothetical protein
MLIAVLLPAPLGPSRPKISPGSIVKEMLLTANVPSYSFDRFFIASAGSVMAIQFMTLQKQKVKACHEPRLTWNRAAGNYKEYIARLYRQRGKIFRNLRN